jgi:hypothetical protein
MRKDIEYSESFLITTYKDMNSGLVQSRPENIKPENPPGVGFSGGFFGFNGFFGFFEK